MSKLSVIMPAYNEQETIRQIVKRVLAVSVPKELIIVDDQSTDGTWNILQELAEIYPEIRLIRHQKNRGKGAAIRTAMRHIQGEVVVIQDADLEYDPEDYHKLLKPILEGRADVVYGSRFLDGFANVSHTTHALANRFLTILSNWLTGMQLSDMETCYKMFKAELVRGLCLTSDRFNIEPELTAMFAKMKVRICEVAISYAGRSYRAGKKIGLWDGLEAIYSIIKFNTISRLEYDHVEDGEDPSPGSE